MRLRPIASYNHLATSKLEKYFHANPPVDEMETMLFDYSDFQKKAMMFFNFENEPSKAKN
jgi:hypothetical protein